MTGNSALGIMHQSRTAHDREGKRWSSPPPSSWRITVGTTSTIAFLHRCLKLLRGPSEWYQSCSVSHADSTVCPLDDPRALRTCSIPRGGAAQGNLGVIGRAIGCGE